MNKINIVGKKFGRLIVLSQFYGHPRKNKTMWLCLCECGNEKVIEGQALRNGSIQSCGCFRKDQLRAKLTTHGLTPRNQIKPPEYAVWASMKSRCLNTNEYSYRNYGGRGIKVCDRWLKSFEDFIIDMGDRPSEAHTIERIDNDGDYCPENCRWATDKEQSRNRRDNVWISYLNETKILSDWAEELSANQGTIRYMMRKYSFHDIRSFFLNRGSHKTIESWKRDQQKIA